MNFKGIRYNFEAEAWQYSKTGAWHFVSLPTELSAEIRRLFKTEEEGWGRLKANAKIGISEWKTALWFDTKLQTYVLPLKAEIRKNEKILIGDSVKVSVWI